MSGIRKLAVKTSNEDSSSQDVTEEYVDNDSQIKNLTQTEQQLNTLLTKANTVGEVLAVQHEVTTVRGQIDQLQGRQNYLSKRASMANITVNVAPVIVAVPEQPVVVEGWSFSKALKNAWEGSLRGLQGLATLLITLLVYVWVLPLVLISLWLVIKLYKTIIQSLSTRYNTTTEPNEINY
jgi:hypothetical protein